MTGEVKPPSPQDSRRRRFWKTASYIEGPEGFTITLDGRPVRLPDRAELRVKSRPLADALVSEWQDAGAADPSGRFGPADLPLTRIAGTMIERIAPDREHIVTTLTDYGRHDLLCYHAEESDPVARCQTESWQPWLDWMRSRYGITLTVTRGLMPATQPEDVITGFRNILNEQTDATLAALGVAVPALGSLILGLALADQALSADEAVRIASLDERTQMERWGEDPSVLDRIAVMAADVSDAVRFMTLARS